jgi:hypothetical protein
MVMDSETVWQFETARFRIALEIEPEDMDPAESFECEDDIEAVRSGEVKWFQAVVAIYLDGKRIAWDSLGGCAYRTFEEFYTSHRDADPMNRNCSLMRAKRGAVTICHYFPSMVSEAIAEARKTLCAAPRMRCQKEA